MGIKFKHLFSSFAFALGFCIVNACSDTNDVAGGVTDIGNSIATITISGTVTNVNGNTIANARIIAYYDNWNQVAATDSIETSTDNNGYFTLEVDSSKNLILYAEKKDICALTFASNTNKLILRQRKSLQSSISGESSGYMRIVGTHETATVNKEGHFSFDAIPPGDISLVYIRDEKPYGFLEFKTTDERNQITLPPLENKDNNNRFYSPYFEGDMFGVDFSFNKKYDTSFLNISLHMDGYEPVFNSDYTRAKDSNFVEGISREARILKPGQYIAIDKQIALSNNFTISLWTKWNGINSNNQILFSEKINGDSVSQIKWYYDNNENHFAVQAITMSGTKTIHFNAKKMQVGLWTFLTLVSNNNELSLYINGDACQIIGNENANFNINNPQKMVSYYIGGTGRENATWNGALDEYHIEGYAQSEKWINAVYNYLAKQIPFQ